MADIDLPGFLEYLRTQSSVSAGTILVYVRALRKFSKLFDDDSLESFNAFINSRCREVSSPYVKYAIAYYLRWVGRADDVNRLVKVRRVKVKKEGNFLSPKVLLSIVGKIKREVHSEVAFLQMITGARAREILTLREERIYFEASSIRLVLVGKGDKLRNVFIDNIHTDKIGRLIQGRAGYVFLPEFFEKLDPSGLEFERKLRTQYTYYYNSIRKAGEAVGVLDFGTHDWRRSVADLLRLVNKDPYAAKEALGHTKIETTLRYFNRSSEEVQESLLNVQKRFRKDGEEE